MSTWESQREPQTEVRQLELEEAPLTRRQLKHRRNKDSKLAKKFKSLDAEISNLKSQMGTLKYKITKASESTSARFKRKKIRSMKREVDKINERLMSQSIPTGYIPPRATPGKIFLSERIPATRANFFV